MLANIVEKWCLRGWYKNQKIPDLCGGAEQLQINNTLRTYQVCLCPDSLQQVVFFPRSQSALSKSIERAPGMVSIK
ncbi:hypothetical protein [Endozoicomonas sp. SCSIO W0465]|uniref:hypothetical protein n=1 Tax=Endozoicomonas sp. SCSIO W0465 TaxID=2918516 RepID=UPI0020750818|nr:hypothetical protein [Endozoicomonas sp. SCSIO W0465]USE36249.1 hypothetical protein MJO57_30140 [Endozoicomonas sp. SCSIO W0465]